MIGKLRLKELIAAGEANPNDASKDFIKITTCSGATPFSEDQIGNDSIDLRTGNEGYRMKRNYEFISTLDETFCSLLFSEISRKLRCNCSFSNYKSQLGSYQSFSVSTNSSNGNTEG